MISDRDNPLETTLAATEKYSEKAREFQTGLQAPVQQDDYAELKNILQRYMYVAEQLQAELRQAFAKVGELAFPSGTAQAL